MKLLKKGSKLHQDIQEVEQLLIKKGLCIEHGYRCIVIKHIESERDFEIIDMDDSEPVHTFPHPFESNYKLL